MAEGNVGVAREHKQDDKTMNLMTVWSLDLCAWDIRSFSCKELNATPSSTSNRRFSSSLESQIYSNFIVIEN